MSSVAIPSAVVTAVVVAVAICVALRLFPSGQRDPTWVIAPAVLIGLWREELAAPERYGDVSGQYGAQLAFPAVAVVVATLGVAICLFDREAIGGHPRTVALDWAVPLAIAAVGVALCVPETQVALVLAGPLVVVAVLATTGLLLPVTAAHAVALIATLGWVVAVDGGSRWSAVVGGSACLVAVALWLVEPVRSSADRSRPVRRIYQIAVLSTVVVICARPAGTHPSAVVALSLSAMALGVGWLALTARRRCNRMPAAA